MSGVSNSFREAAEREMSAFWVKEMEKVVLGGGDVEERKIRLTLLQEQKNLAILKRAEERETEYYDSRVELYQNWVRRACLQSQQWVGVQQVRIDAQTAKLEESLAEKAEPAPQKEEKISRSVPPNPWMGLCFGGLGALVIAVVLLLLIIALAGLSK